MRSKNASKNLAMSIVYEMFIMLMGLIIPRLIIITYGDSINGLTSTITRLLSLINLIQAGAVGTAIYQMYKPVAEGDYEKQSSILYSAKKFYYTTGTVYLIVAVFVAIFYGFYLDDPSLEPAEIISAFIILALSGATFFFFTSRFDITFSSYQKRYLLTFSTIIERVFYYAILLMILFAKAHFLWMYVASLASSLVRVAVNQFFYRKLTRGKITNNPINKSFKIPDRKYLMMSSIGGQAIEAAPTVIISTFLSLALSSVFSIYALVYTSMKMLINSVQLSISAVFGNLVATSDDIKISRVFNDLVYMFTIIGAFLASCTAFLFMPFIGIYTEGISEISYNYPVLAALIVFYIAIFAMRSVFGFVSTVYGLFKDTCKITLICGGIGILISFGCTMVFGIPYVMVGLIFYNFCSMMVLFWIFKKKISWFNTKKLGRRMVALIGFPTLSWVSYNVLNLQITTWIAWLIAAIGIAAISIIFLIVYSLIFERTEMRSLFGYVRGILMRS
jgi:O-antigen/teichoic acid export membrane protein